MPPRPSLAKIRYFETVLPTTGLRLRFGRGQSQCARGYRRASSPEVYNPEAMKRHSRMFLTLGSLILTGCSQSAAPDNPEAEARVLREGEVTAFVNDWGGKDADRIAAHYADDGNVMIPNSPTMTGKDAIAKGMKEGLADPTWSLALQPVQG